MAHEFSDATRRAPEDPEFTKAEAAEYRGVSQRTIDTWIARGYLRAYRLRGSRLIRIRKSDLDAMLVEIEASDGAA